ncbi:unnamed protein product [Heligmosomoides polygyrus]|uniref:HTH psq-type domain-containing protein n=1 Tax=Heligmosomoides polygyrus TaxID=6339 RepID=A0A3P8DK93_HELPZ|nr:unnamed protein product [Heligmosomoides polygyrus]
MDSRIVDGRADLCPAVHDAQSRRCLLCEQERRKKKPYKELTLHEKVQLIRLAEENSGMSQAAIAERYTIAKSNVCRILQRKKEYLMAYETAGYAGSRKRKLKSAATTDIIDSRPMGGGGGGGGLLVPADVSRSDGNETLRAHMYKQHQISRMFMCRCCNWAFPDKTSLHMHIQAREEGKTITVPVIGKGLAPDGVDSPYTLHTINNNNTLPQMQNPGVLSSTPSLSFFSAPPPPSLSSSAEDMSRLRDRLVLNSLMTQPGFGLAAAWLNHLPKPIPSRFSVVSARKTTKVGFGLAAAWLNHLPKPIPTTKPLVELMKKDSREDDDCEVNVDNDSPSDDDKASALFQQRVRREQIPSNQADRETKLTMADNKCRYLESRGNTLQTEAARAQAQISSAEAALRALEAETRALREQTEMLHRRLLDCQEQAVRFMQCDRASNPQAVAMFMNHLIQSTIIR